MICDFSARIWMANLSNLPLDIMVSILTRLPTESVLGCKLVCKQWRDLICHHPSFSQLHLAHLNHSADSGELRFLVKPENQNLQYFEYNEDNDEKPIDCIRKVNINPPFTYDYKVIGSSNGLVCLYGVKEHTACVCNPVTREYVMLPNIKRDCDHAYVYLSSGFGYIPLTDEYKVVELYWKEIDFVEVAVYTLGSGTGWRNVGRLDSMIQKDKAGVFTNGALYWNEVAIFIYVDGVLDLVEEGEERLLVFDLSDEKFREHGLLSPPPPADENVSFKYFTGDMGGVLYYTTRELNEITHSKCSNIWLLKNKNVILDMKEQVGHESLGWSKEFDHLDKKPLAITKNGGILWYDNNSLGIYDPIASTSRVLVDVTAFVVVYTHKNTLVSLKELGEEDIQTMEPAEEKEIHDLTS